MRLDTAVYTVWLNRGEHISVQECVDLITGSGIFSEEEVKREVDELQKEFSEYIDGNLILDTEAMLKKLERDRELMLSFF